MATSTVDARAAGRSPWETIVAVAALVSLALWPIEINRAFGLPAHPLIIHVPVVFIPILGVVVLAAMFKFGWFERYGLLITRSAWSASPPRCWRSAPARPSRRTSSRAFR